MSDDNYGVTEFSEHTPEEWEKIKAALRPQEFPWTPDGVKIGEELPGLNESYFKLDHNIHIAKPFPIPEHWPRYHAIDYGDPVTMVSIARDPESGTFYVYDGTKKLSRWERLKMWIRRIWR